MTRIGNTLWITLDVIADRGVTMESDISYFRRRCSEERTAALQSRDGKTRQAHLELAERYEDLVRGMSVHEFEGEEGDRSYG